MMTTREAFEKFKGRLELSDKEAKDAQRRHAEVRAHIAADFDVKRDFLSGSYGRHTKTKPLKDVDIFFVLGSKEAQRRSKPAVELLDAFEKCMRKHYSASAVSRGRRCITVEFEKPMYEDGSDEKVLSIDLIPAFEAGNDYEIPDRDKGEAGKGAWIKTNPETHKTVATKKNEQMGGTWKPLVKMLKAWNRHNGKPIKPAFLVEVMALDLINPEFSSYPNELRNFFGAAQEAIGRSWPDPAGLGPPVSDQMTPELVAAAKTALANAEMKATVAARAEAQGNQGDCLAHWQQILGPLFAKT